jgi:hypothetical protein
LSGSVPRRGKAAANTLYHQGDNILSYNQYSSREARYNEVTYAYTKDESIWKKPNLKIE